MVQAALTAAVERGDATEAQVSQLQDQVSGLNGALAARDRRTAQATAQAELDLSTAEERASAAEVPLYPEDPACCSVGGASCSCM